MRDKQFRRDGALKNNTTIKTQLEAAAGAAVDEEERLAPYTSFHIGGPARFFVNAADATSLAKLIKVSRELALDTIIIGGGTNLLVSDRGFDGLAIRLAFDEMTLDPERMRATVQAGFPTAKLVEQSVQAGLSGLAFAAGLPGTVGGGLAGNAGCFGQTLSDALIRATVVSRDGDIFEVTDPTWFQFEYRHSRLLRAGHVIVDGVFRLTAGERESLMAESEKHIQLRREKHPAPGSYTAGSYFKNLPPKNCGERRQAAGWYLDQVGAKELKVGDAGVFERHANIVVNRGSATAEDVLNLTGEMTRRVKEKFGIELQPEVRFVGERR